ncbi:hypothetical protein DFA_03386 [Cavenderia fasciculata]|uniref:Transmembrane protein n=1 Tax=Cavenderia fasciculata TaxID=261658 RepID=F4PHF5_CACFS|nr:uncharacterized protein DFA_03386 [Cavenderia fasciculata]EGG25139.1 hypothetical protein DFA_03386 [Cavenderia fasciculata]|eukprot:XP_004362990.1 hypothetical protein DFA_03386 [Cavenderia fasciculata]
METYSSSKTDTRIIRYGYGRADVNGGKLHFVSYNRFTPTAIETSTSYRNIDYRTIFILDKQFGYQAEYAIKELSTLTKEEVEHYKWAYNSGMDIIFPISIAVDMMIGLAKLYTHNKFVTVIQFLPLMFMFSDLIENYYIYNTLKQFPLSPASDLQLIQSYLKTGSQLTISKSRQEAKLLEKQNQLKAK